MADDEINEESLERMRELGGNAVNINVYYEYDEDNGSFILLSNLTKIEEKIRIAHDNGFLVFLSPFVNMIGGYYTGGMIEDPDDFLNGAMNITLNLASFAEKNDVEMYAVWNELGLAIHRVKNATMITNEWLQDAREKVRRVYHGILTTKEGVQFGLYEDYNFSGFDCIGVTFYPFTTSFARHPATNQTLAGVETLDEYERVVKDEYRKLNMVKRRFDSECLILGEIGIDVVGGKFIGNDEESRRIRAEAYRIVLENGKGIDGFFFSKFHEVGDVFRNYFR